MDSGGPQISTSSPLRGPRFTLRALLLVVLLAAIAFAVLFSTPTWIAVPAAFALTIAVPALLTVRIIYGDRHQRAFYIGAIFPCGTLLFTTSWAFGLLVLLDPPRSNALKTTSDWLEFFENIDPQFRAICGVAWALAVVIGLLCVSLQWLLLKPNSHEPS